jgi:gas vesicle protein
MNDNSKVLVALMAGLAAGVALGILFAPEKGSETRDKLNDALKNLGDSIKDRAAEEIDNLTDLKEKVINSIKSNFKTVEDVKAAATNVASRASAAANNITNPN